MPAKSERNISFDIMRVFAAMMVVYQHACGNTVIELSVESLAKIAVPLFLMITGFFYNKVLERGKAKSQIMKTLKYALIIVSVYFVIDFLHAVLKHNVSAYMHQYVNSENIKRFLIFNDPIPGDHSWYLWALLYVLVLTQLIPQIRLYKKLIFFICIVLLICVGKYSPFVFGKSLEFIYCRNFFATGMPFFLIGNILYDSDQKIKEKKALWKYMIIIFSATSIMEYLIYSMMGIIASGYYISTILLAISIFCYFQSKEWDQKYTGIARFGRRYVFGIYFIHVEFVVIEKKLLPMNNGMGFIGFICVLIASIITSVVMTDCLDCVRKSVIRRNA